MKYEGRGEGGGDNKEEGGGGVIPGY